MGQAQGTGTSELCIYVFYSTTVGIPLCPLPFALPYFVGCPAHSGPPTPDVVDQDGSVELLPIKMFHVEGK